MAITLEAIRAAGGIVHSDGNIFFRDISMLQALAGAAPAAVTPRTRDLLGIVRTAQAEARRLINGEDSGSDLAQTKLDLPETLRVLEHALSQPAAVAGPPLDVTLDEDQAGLLRDMLGDPTEYEEALTVRLIVCDGHSGHGLYVAQAEYQDEGAVLLAPLPALAAPALEAPAAPAPNIEGLLDEDGENQAVRTFLMLYGTELTVARMREDMELAGWPQAPGWTKEPEAQGHLTKEGAQDWLRHLFALEASPLAAAPVGKATEARISAVMELVKEWSQCDLIAAESGIDALSEECSEKDRKAALILSEKAEEAYRAIESALRTLLEAAPQAPAARDELSQIAAIVACWGCDHPDDPGDTEVVRRVKWAARQLRAAAQAPAAPSADVISDGEFFEMAVAAGASRGPKQSATKPPVFPTWGAWGRFCDSVRAAPAAPAVDAETIKKAARYDWLRDFHNGPDGVQANLPHIAAGSDNDLVWALIGEDADAGIDAALAAQAKEGGAK